MANNGTVNIEAIVINNVDFYGAFLACDIYEDIFTNTWSGHIDITETESIRESMPIIGEETIVIRFSSIKPITNVPDPMLQFIGRVTKLDILREGNAAQRIYRLYFQSIWADVNQGARCRKSYKGTATSVAKKIMNSQIYGNALMDVDPAKYTQHFVFPNLSPFQCVNFLSSVAVSSKYEDPYYLFYEDRNGFHMTTLSKLMDKQYIDIIKSVIVPDIRHEMADDTLISVMQFNPLFDTMDLANSGMYGGTLIGYDKIRKKFTEKTATYSGTYNRWKHVAKKKLTIMRPESPKNRFQFIMVNEPTNPGIYLHTDDWALPGWIRNPQIRGHRAQLHLNRGTHFELGDVLKWDIRSTADEKVEDRILSGKWLITRIHHVITHISYNAFVELIKDGRG